jgi:hypothetical protein
LCREQFNAWKWLVEQTWIQHWKAALTFLYGGFSFEEILAGFFHAISLFSKEPIRNRQSNVPKAELVA